MSTTEPEQITNIEDLNTPTTPQVKKQKDPKKVKAGKALAKINAEAGKQLAKINAEAGKQLVGITEKYGDVVAFVKLFSTVGKHVSFSPTNSDSTSTN